MENPMNCSHDNPTPDSGAGQIISTRDAGAVQIFRSDGPRRVYEYMTQTAPAGFFGPLPSTAIA